jgi:tRNA pseudouridine38-40 synthase
MVLRYKIKLEYDGSNFAGWQQQKRAISIQEKIQDAIYKFSREKVQVYGAGRTDAGVHALGQVAHFDMSKYYASNKIIDAMNHFLKGDTIVVLEIELVNDSFHARFSAKSRSYIYRIINRRAALTIERNRAWHVIKNLDVEVMHVAAQQLVGNHDYSSFRSTCCQSLSSQKTIDIITVRKSPYIKDLIEINISARSFLHNQVRIIVGTLYKIGTGSWKIDKINKILAAKNRSAAGQTAPPYGLYLYEIRY